MSPATTKHAWAAWAAFWWILLENAALGFPCAICNLLGTDNKETIVYELVLLALCIAMDVWCGKLASSYPVLYGDNDSVKFVLIRGTGLRDVASAIMQLPLETEVHFNTNIWFARVLTETNIADVPSRFLTLFWMPNVMGPLVLLNAWQSFSAEWNWCTTSWNSRRSNLTSLHPESKREGVSKRFLERLRLRKHDLNIIV